MLVISLFLSPIVDVFPPHICEVSLLFSKQQELADLQQHGRAGHQLPRNDQPALRWALVNSLAMTRTISRLHIQGAVSEQTDFKLVGVLTHAYHMCAT